MKKQLTLVALGASITFSGLSFAAKADKADKPLRGRITSVTPDDKNSKALDLEITSGGKANPKTTTVVVDETAQITLDGQSAKLSDLAKGERVEITPSTGTPQTITALSKGHKKSAVDAGPAPATQPSK